MDDPYRFGQELAGIAIALLPIALIIGGVALTWWLIVRARRDAPARPTGYRDPAYPPPPEPVRGPPSGEPPANR